MLDRKSSSRQRSYSPRRNSKQVRFRVSADSLLRLEKEARSRRVSVNYLVGVLVDDALSKATPDSAWETGLKLMAEVKARQKNIGTDIECMFETLCFFVYQWFCHTTPLPESQRRAAAIDGKHRFEKFLELVRSKLNEGRSPFSRLLEGEEEAGKGPEVANG